MQKNVEKTDATADEVQYADAVRYAVQYDDGRNAKRPLHCDFYLLFFRFCRPQAPPGRTQRGHKNRRGETPPEGTGHPHGGEHRIEF